MSEPMDAVGALRELVELYEDWVWIKTYDPTAYENARRKVLDNARAVLAAHDARPATPAADTIIGRWPPLGLTIGNPAADTKQPNYGAPHGARDDGAKMRDDAKTPALAGSTPATPPADVAELCNVLRNIAEGLRVMKMPANAERIDEAADALQRLSQEARAHADEAWWAGYDAAAMAGRE